MSSPQMYQPQAVSPNKGTLVAGQSITVNKFNVQVERYLSQGGFAHVYLVRTAVPVYNTTHHVLKRIAVSNEAMLSEVKKEVDVMRLLKGHPNIVHLIDAAWHRMQNGMYEVFILMEFCPGGGIIDMMNRRLRERLTEAEILQIFVDVCEGVACMHNLKPPLLHRDLKVENILQSSPTSFKLCDFGSAAVVSKPPTSTQEIRALEADLNRHTTLQYRAPEMVDPYQRRPVDEKSDVWALGVLLYKLCYYTTPFEEHGPLAILNVQYRIPPYPVYSSQMNGLIGSMLREHGYQRPSVFELLNEVHRLRGTKSQFHYDIPSNSNIISPKSSASIMHPLDNVISYRSSPSRTPAAPPSSSPSKNAGIQAREKVLEAIEPMRRGRPTISSHPDSSSRSASPAVHADKPADWLDRGFGNEEEKSWKVATMKTNSQVSRGGNQMDSAWSIDKARPRIKDNAKDGFGDDFGEKLWKEFKRTTGNVKSSSPAIDIRPSSTSPVKRDAFDGLGISSSTQEKAPTLAEARKLRTGLASVHGSSYDTNKSARPPPSPRPASYLSPPHGHPSDPLRQSSSGSSWSSQPPVSRPGSSNEAETRFPSLEELDAQFSPSISHTRSATTTNSRVKAPMATSSDRSSEPISRKSMPHPSSYTESPQLKASDYLPAMSSSHHENGQRARRPSLTRKHRSSVIVNQSSNPTSNLDPSSSATSVQSSSSRTPEMVTAVDVTPKLPLRPSAKQYNTKDWLTGSDSDTTFDVMSRPPQTSEKAIVRESPSKRASVTMRPDIPIPEAISASYGQIPAPRHSETALIESPTTSISRVNHTFPPIEPPTNTTTPTSTLRVSQIQEPETSSSGDEGPEDANGYAPKPKSPESKRPKRKGRQSSVHDLVDLWGGGVPTEKDVEPVKSTVAPISYKPVSEDSLLKRRSTRLPSISTAAKGKSTPAAAVLSPRTGRTSHSSSPSTHSTSVKTPTSSRSSRPQSMYAFPTSPPLETPSSIGSSGLVPPDEAKPRAIRRTSITDMVQKFEAKGSSKPPPPSKPSMLSPSKSQPGDSRVRSAVTGSLSVRGSESSDTRSQTPSTSGFPVPTTSTLRSTPSGPLKDDNATPRARRTSTLKPEHTNISFLSSKSSLEDIKLVETRSPSPERPYQGVGKLIDQWQRKAETVNPPGTPKRGGFVAKRTTLVSGGGSQ